MRNGTEKPFHAIDINVNYFYKRESLVGIPPKRYGGYPFSRNSRGVRPVSRLKNLVKVA